MKDQGGAIAARFRGPLWLPLAIVWLAVCAPADDPAPEFFPDIVVARPGDTLAVFPPPGDTSVLLARVNGLALADDEQSVYVLDEGNYQVHRIDLEGNLLASMGSEGEGPGELESPVAIHAAEGGGVWVLDSQHQRVTRFGPDGTLVESANPGQATGFTLSPFGDGVLVPTMGAPPFQDPAGHPETLLTFFSAANTWELAGPPLMPPVLSSGDFFERMAGWKLAPVSAGEVAILLSSSEPRGWRAFVDAAAERVDSLVELPIPGDLRQRIAEIEVEPDARFRPFSRIEMVGDRLWIVSVGMVDPVAFTIPLAEGEPSIRVLAEGLNRWREGLRVQDIIVLDDRLIVARDIEVMILEWSAESG